MTITIITKITIIIMRMEMKIGNFIKYENIKTE